MSSTVNLADDLSPTFYTDQVTVGTSIVQVIPDEIDIMKGVQLKSNGGNAGTIYIGRSTVATGNGFALEAGEGLFISIEDVTKIYAIASSAGQTLHWLAL